jgi:hypothetical protein
MSSAQQILGQFVKNIFKIKKHAMFEVPLPDQEVLNSIFLSKFRNKDVNK